jgi:probable rRNA maturation factor
MAKLKIECLDKKVSTRKIAKAVYKVLWQKARFKVELVFHDGEDMHNLNRTTRGVDSVTDVLSYPSMDGIKGLILTPEQCRTEMEGKYIFLGSIVLCDEKIRAQAKEFGHAEKRERDYLIIHGLLHLFGYDHMNDQDKKEMRDKEKQIMAILYPEEAENIVEPTSNNAKENA